MGVWKNIQTSNPEKTLGGISKLGINKMNHACTASSAGLSDHCSKVAYACAQVIDFWNGDAALFSGYNWPRIGRTR
jgi:hypothetical protein